MKKFKKMFCDYIEDVFIFLGLLIIVLTTLSINLYIGMYVLAFILIVLGLYIAKIPPKRR